MATLVKFYKDTDGDILAFFPQLNHNKHLYGNKIKTCYLHIGQHTSCDVNYVKRCKVATHTEYADLLRELKQQGYTELKVLNK